MDIQLIREDNSTDAILSVNITMADIEEQANESLKKNKQKLNLPGFRKGMIPTGIAKKYLWEGIIREELEKKLESSIESYFEEQKLNIIRPVLPIRPDTEPDFKNFESFDFRYNTGLINSFIIDKEKAFKKLERLAVEISAEDIENEIKRLRQQHGKHSSPEVVESKESIRMYIELTELNDEGENFEGGFTKKFAKTLGEFNHAFKTELLGKKVNEIYEINLNELFSDRQELANFLDIEKPEAEDLNPKFRLKLIAIHDFEEADLNEDFFKTASYGKASTLEELRTEVESILKDSNQKSAEAFLHEQIREALLHHVQIDMPQKFLNLLFEEEQKEHKNHQHSIEELDKERKKFEDNIKWSIIFRQTAKENEIDVNEDEIVSETYEFLYSYFYMTGRFPDPKEIEKYIIEYLRNPSNALYIKDRVLSKKVLNLMTSTHQFKEKKISLSDFNKLRTEKQKVKSHNHE